MGTELEKALKKIQNDGKALTDSLDATKSQLQTVDDHLAQVKEEQARVTEITKAPMVILNDIDDKFKKATKLTSRDITFLFVATAIQIVRQYLITKFPSERLSDKEAAKLAKGDITEKSNRKHRLYNPGLPEIITNPVPFDASDGSKKYGALKDFGALGHRGATPGHDPVFGFVFGTANIATSTLTNWRMESYHIKTATRDFFASRAKTELVFQYTFDKLFNEGLEGKIKIGASLCKEYIHLKSDIYSKNSLPFPAISTVSPKFAGDLASFGIDAANVVQVGKQALYACLINTIVAMIHRMFYDPSESSLDLYRVRTKKILSYSNLIASTSNVIVTACTRDIELMDIGGLAVTLYRLITDIKFISAVKEEFIKEEFYNRIVGTPYDFMEG